jgi:hypothetical protein
MVAISATVSPIDPAESSKRRRGNDSADRPDRAAELALKAFMSMNRAVAIVGHDGKLLQPNLVFEKLFGDTELLDRINRDASANNGKSDCQITLPDVRAVASIGQSLGMATVAEGVETEEQMARIASDGCTDVQGYLISRPMPPEQIGSFLLLQNESVLRNESEGLASPDQQVGPLENPSFCRPFYYDISRYE